MLTEKDLMKKYIKIVKRAQVGYRVYFRIRGRDFALNFGYLEKKEAEFLGRAFASALRTVLVAESKKAGGV